MEGDGNAIAGGGDAGIQIDRLAELTGEARGRILSPMAEPATLQSFVMSPHYVALALSDGERTEGGLIAQTYWDWMHIEVVAVPERWRGLGLGRRLIEAAEAVALEHGCHSAWVDTYSFQAPDFYAAVGYSVFGRLPDYPRGEERIFYAKRLASSEETKP